MLREVMQNAGLIKWPLISFILFFGFFSSLLVWIFRRGSTRFYEEMSTSILDDSNILNPIEKGKVNT